MVLNQSVEEIISLITELDRQSCIEELRGMSQLKLDFTDDFLEQMTLERLRHILAAAALQARKSVAHLDKPIKKTA